MYHKCSGAMTENLGSRGLRAFSLRPEAIVTNLGTHKLTETWHPSVSVAACVVQGSNWV